MSLVEWNPLRDMSNFSKEMSNFLERSPFSTLYNQGMPRIDVYETENDVIVKAELPGVAKEDLEVFVDENMLKLSGHTKKSSDFKDEDVYRTERYYGGFSRAIPFPVEVISDSARAEYKDGILSITVPKSEAAKKKGRKIEID